MFLIFIVGTSFLFQENNPNILWSNKRLIWKNFKKQPDSINMASRIRAVTSSKLEQRYFVTPEHQIHFTILAWFVPDKSWVKLDVVNNYNNVISDLVLEHEQHHFDIVELYARQIRQALSKIIFYDSTFKRDIPKLFKKYYDQYREDQKRYDSEAGHGEFRRQQDWVNSIDDQLKALKKYSDTCVIVNIY